MTVECVITWSRVLSLAVRKRTPQQHWLTILDGVVCVNRQIGYTAVIRLSDKYGPPDEAALLYDFVNSLDLRSYVHKGIALCGDDELATTMQLADWMSAHKLLKAGSRVTREEHGKAIKLREALRSFFQNPPNARLDDPSANARLNKLFLGFPLVMNLSKSMEQLRPAPGSSILSLIVAEFCRLAESNQLERMKMCGSDQCHWIFYDVSKPANRRWCSSERCGNREKTRTYRRRRTRVNSSATEA